MESADPLSEGASAESGPHLHSISGPGDFAVEGRLRKNVDFWVSIYSKYYTHQGVVHDAKYVDKVFELLDFSKAPREKQRMIRASKRRWKEILLSIHRKQERKEELNEDERHVFELYADVDEPNKFLNAAHRKRLRFQLGQKDRFIDGLKYSGRYLPLMEEIFRREKLPLELTRLPFVESSFNIKALSKVGASGIWQFMPSTARLFIRVDDVVDERNDPIRATEAAAKLLKMNYESLGRWPLAVTAYNHGRKGMMRAVRKVGSDDFAEIVESYRSRNFGFASSNFFTCLLAAIEVEKNAEQLFGPIAREPLMQAFEAKLPDSINLYELIRFLKLNPKAIRELNPGLSPTVLSGRKLLPAGYQLRLPHDGKVTKESAARIFLAGYSKIPKMFKGKRKPARNYDRGVSAQKFEVKR